MPPPHGERPTMNDVAADAGVSLKTVSRVVNDVSTVDPVLAERVRASIRKLGFRPNVLAASLRRGAATRTIGLIIADLSNVFYMMLASAIAAAARDRGFQVIIADSEDSPETERDLALDLCQRQVSGLIIVPTGSDHSYLRSEIDRGTPVVAVDRPVQGIDVDTFVIDNREGARAAIARMIRTGHRRIGVMVDTLELYTMRERLQGAQDALADEGIALDPSLTATDVHSPDDAVREVGRMLDLAEPPTAVLCGNNRSTIGAFTEMWRRGLQIDVTGFDDFELSWLLPHPVTIVDYNVGGLGAAAATRLFDRIDGSPTESVTRRLPTVMISRGGSWHGLFARPSD